MRAASVGGAFTMNETCPTCRGRGLVVDDPCPTCHGSGRGMSNRTISARIPAGVKDGQRIRLRGKGANGERGGPAGDLYVTVHVAGHHLFGRKGDNLTLTVPVSFDEAALGADIKVPTLGGAPVTLKVPAGTPNGRSFRVRGRGVQRKDGRQHGRPAGDRRGAGARPGSTTRPAPPSRRSARPPPDPTCAPTSSTRAPRPAARHERAGRGTDAGARGPGLRHQRRRRAHRPAPADPAHLRPARPGPARPHRRRRPALLVARHRAAPRGRRAELHRHRPRGRTPDPRARAPVDALQRRVVELEHDLAAAEYTLRQTLAAQQSAHARTCPPCGPPRRPASRSPCGAAARASPHLLAAIRLRSPGERPPAGPQAHDGRPTWTHRSSPPAARRPSTPPSPPRRRPGTRRSRRCTCSPRCSPSRRASSTRCSRPSARSRRPSRPGSAPSSAGCPPRAARRSAARRTPGRRSRCSTRPVTWPRRCKDDFISTEHLLLAAHQRRLAGQDRAGRSAGATFETLSGALTSVRGTSRVTSQDPEATYQALEKYAVDLTAAAAEGKLDPVIGRDAEIRRRGPGAVAPHQEQPRADRRARRRQDRRRRGARPAGRRR